MCVCGITSPYNKATIQCVQCQKWSHTQCVKLTLRTASKTRYICHVCRGPSCNTRKEGKKRCNSDRLGTKRPRQMVPSNLTHSRSSPPSPSRNTSFNIQPIGTVSLAPQLTVVESNQSTSPSGTSSTQPLQPPTSVSQAALPSMAASISPTASPTCVSGVAHPPLVRQGHPSRNNEHHSADITPVQHPSMISLTSAQPSPTPSSSPTHPPSLSTRTTLLHPLHILPNPTQPLIPSTPLLAASNYGPTCQAILEGPQTYDAFLCSLQHKPPETTTGSISQLAAVYPTRVTVSTISSYNTPRVSPSIHNNPPTVYVRVLNTQIPPVPNPHHHQEYL